MSPRCTTWLRPSRSTIGAGRRGGARAALIVNTQARRRAGDVVRAERRLEKGGVPVATSDAVRHGARPPATVRAALTEGHDLLSLDGGDGSVRTGVVELAHHGSVRHSGPARS